MALELKPNHLKLEPDRALADMLQHMNLFVHETRVPFEPDGGAYASHAGRSHGH